MRLSKLISFLGLFLLLSGGQVLLLADRAYAAPCCRVGTCYAWCACNCTARVQACVDQLTGGEEFTIKTKRSGPVQLVAEPDVLKQLLDFKEKGKVACGTYSLRLIGNIENMKLKCIKFEPDGPMSKEVEKMTLELEEAKKAMSLPMRPEPKK